MIMCSHEVNKSAPVNHSNMVITYTLLEGNDLVISECISFCDDRYQVNFGVQPAHKLDINLLEAYYVHSRSWDINGREVST